MFLQRPLHSEGPGAWAVLRTPRRLSPVSGPLTHEQAPGFLGLRPALNSGGRPPVPAALPPVPSTRSVATADCPVILPDPLLCDPLTACPARPRFAAWRSPVPSPHAPSCPSCSPPRLTFSLPSASWRPPARSRGSSRGCCLLPRPHRALQPPLRGALAPGRPPRDRALCASPSTTSLLLPGGQQHLFLCAEKSL